MSTRTQASLVSFLATVAAGALFAVAWGTKQEVYAVFGGLAIAVSGGIDFFLLKPKT